ncbi:MAG TPA: hypothetical protein VGM75_14970 [Pseudonocardiaceae bacterium]|jgi:hypothetical protein
MTTVLTAGATELAGTRFHALRTIAEVMVTAAAALAPAEDIVRGEIRPIGEACMPARLVTVDGSVTVMASWPENTAPGIRQSATTARETR